MQGGRESSPDYDLNHELYRYIMSQSLDDVLELEPLYARILDNISLFGANIFGRFNQNRYELQHLVGDLQALGLLHRFGRDVNNFDRNDGRQDPPPGLQAPNFVGQLAIGPAEPLGMPAPIMMPDFELFGGDL
jgi:hypothetical protein